MIKSKQLGFTIIELLVVIVVIGILAAITSVSFNGIQNRARQVAVQAELKQASTKILLYTIDNSGAYPAGLLDVELASADGYEYSVDNAANPRTFCLTLTDGAISYYVSSVITAPANGACPGHTGGVGAVVFPQNQTVNLLASDALSGGWL